LLLINTINNEKDLEFLLTKAVSVDTLSEDLYKFVQDLKQTAEHTTGCVGLAANQVWKHNQLPIPSMFVYLNISNEWVTVINPSIKQIFKKNIEAIEMCMSVPGIKVKVSRPRHIAVSFYDEDLKLHEKHLFDIEARVFLHEYDHLQGKLINANTNI